MKKIVRLTESDLVKLIKRVINEQNIDDVSYDKSKTCTQTGRPMIPSDANVFNGKIINFDTAKCRTIQDKTFESWITWNGNLAPGASYFLQQGTSMGNTKNGKLLMKYPLETQSGGQWDRGATAEKGNPGYGQQFKGLDTNPFMPYVYNDSNSPNPFIVVEFSKTI